LESQFCDEPREELLDEFGKDDSEHEDIPKAIEITATKHLRIFVFKNMVEI
jgi:hypothetical protein